MKIGIIGAGHIGGTLVRRLRALGHDVTVANSRGPSTLSSLAAETGAHVATVREAARGKDLVVVSIPVKAIPELPDALFDSDKTIVVDTGNYYPKQRDGRIDAIEAGTPESKWVEQQLGHPVIKAFNSMYAQHLMENGRPAGDPRRLALPVAGDSPDAKKKVIDLIDQLGFDAVDAGDLSESWRQQPGTPVYGADLTANEVRRALADADHERPGDFRADASASAGESVRRSARPDAPSPGGP